MFYLFRISKKRWQQGEKQGAKDLQRKVSPGRGGGRVGGSLQTGSPMICISQANVVMCVQLTFIKIILYLLSLSNLYWLLKNGNEK